MTTGIYLLKFGDNDLPYIGKSRNIEFRYNAHISKLNNGIHTKKLQNAFEKYGAPVLQILLICKEDHLDLYEMPLIRSYNSAINGFNTLSVSVNEGLDTPTNTGLRGEDNPMSKYLNVDIEEVFFYLVNIPSLTSKEISEITGVSKSTIDSISMGRLHSGWLQQKFPEDFNKMLNSRLNHSKYGKGKTLKDRGIIYPKIISPEGISFLVENTSEFAKIHNLNNGHLVQVLRGTEKSHKGWRLE